MRPLDELETEPLTEPVELSENALASEFTRRYLDDLRYVHEWGKWLRWDGRRWAVERTLAVYDLARKLVRRSARASTNKKIAARIESAATVNAIVSLARADRGHARVSEDFDADRWLLNTPGRDDRSSLEREPAPASARGRHHEDHARGPQRRHAPRIGPPALTTWTRG